MSIPQPATFLIRKNTPVCDPPHGSHTQSIVPIVFENSQCCIYIFFSKALLDYVKRDQSKGHALKQGLLQDASPWNLSGSGEPGCNTICSTMQASVTGWVLFNEDNNMFAPSALPLQFPHSWYPHPPLFSLSPPSPLLLPSQPPHHTLPSSPLSPPYMHPPPSPSLPATSRFTPGVELVICRLFAACFQHGFSMPDRW